MINQLIGLDRSQSQLIQVQFSATFPDVTTLRARLIAPTGDEVILFTNVGTLGANKANFISTELDDLGATPIQNGTAPFTGSFIPQLPLSALDGTPFAGEWRLEITNDGASTGTITDFRLVLPFAVPDTGLGEPIADRFTAGFRVFVQDPTNPLTQTVWTPVGPAPQTGLDLENGIFPDSATGNSNYAANAGRVTAVAVDPSDPSGNTVYIGAGSGGVWKTTNFLTQDPAGPTWVPLTDFGPTQSLVVSSITLIPVNNDANQTIVLALTGRLNDGLPLGESNRGVGILRSTDAGRTWKVLDSLDNRDPNDPGRIAPIVAPSRDRAVRRGDRVRHHRRPDPGPDRRVLRLPGHPGAGRQSGCSGVRTPGSRGRRSRPGPRPTCNWPPAAPRQ